jgi:hypothetical protein
MNPAAMHPAAAQELRDVVEYYEGIDPELADAFLTCFDGYRDRISESPLHFNLRKGGVRRANLFPRFREYYLPFMIWNDQVVILAVAHAKRRPFYWRRRVEEAKQLF